MKRWHKETLLAALLLILPTLLLYRDGFSAGEIIDINIHDAYFVADRNIALLAVFAIVSFPVYLVRAMSGRFRHLAVNGILMALTITMIVLLWYVEKMIEFVYDGGWTIYPPLSALPQEIPERESPVHIAYIYICQALLLLLFAFTLYRTIKKPMRS